MSKSKVFLTLGIVMAVVMIAFVAFALQHPEMSFAGGNKVAYPVYIIYLIVTIAMFILSATTTKK